jgi:hypothetical protein
MPSNFNQTLDNPQVGSVASSYQPDTTKDALLIGRIGSSFKDLATVMAKGQTDDSLGQVSYELADVENRAIAYNQMQSDLTTQMLSADEAVRTKAQEEFSKLRNGQIQGVLSPSTALTRTNNIIKQYSVAYPHLAKEIRAMANQSIDNFDQYYRQILGNDPIAKQAQETLREAVKYQTTPSAIISRNVALAESDARLKELDMRLKQNDLDQKGALGLVQSASLPYVTGRLSQLTTQWAMELKSGTLSNNDILVRVNDLKQEVYQKFMPEMVRSGLVSSDQIEATLKPAILQIETVEKMLSGTATAENVLAALKAASEKKELQTTEQQAAFWQQVHSIIGPLGAEMSEDVVAAAIAVASSPRRDDKALWDDAARAGLVDQNPALALGLVLYRSPEGKKLIAQAVGMKLSGNPQSTGNPVLDAAATRDFDTMVGKVRSMDERAALVGGAMGGFDWQDIMNNKNIRLAVQSNPNLTAQAANKAASHMAGLVREKGVDPKNIIIDHSDLKNPIKIKGEKIGPNSFVNRAPTDEEFMYAPVGTQLSKVYWEVLNSLGATGLDQFISELGLDKVPKKDKSSEAQKKSPNEVVSKVINYNKQFGLPEAAIRAVMDQESSGGKYLRASNDPATGQPKSSARGPMHILKGTFDEANAKFFKGKLDWDNDEHQILASLAHFKFLYERNGRDLNTVFKRWYGHEDPAENDKYAASVTKRMASYGG